MNPKSAAVFSLACLLTVIGWSLLWPSPAVHGSPAPTREAIADPRGESASALAVIASLEAAKSDDERLQAALQLGQIPAAEIPATLENIELIKDHRLTLPAKTLLIRWAGSDGPAAMKWAWQRLRGKSVWTDALREIGPAWAWRDPAGFGNWVLARVEARGGTDDVTLEEAKASKEPILDSDSLSEISGWLLQENPRLAVMVFLKRGGTSTADSAFWKSLTDPRKIEQAMLAFDQKSLDAMKAFDGTGNYTFGPEFWAETLLKNWKEADAEGFSKSAYAEYLPRRDIEAPRDPAQRWQEAAPAERAETADRIVQASAPNSRNNTVVAIANAWCAADADACREWLETLPVSDATLAAAEWVQAQAAGELDATLDWIDRFEPGIRAAHQVRAFDAWTAAHPGEMPDTSGWSEERRQAWDDLQALKSIGTP